MSKSKEVAASVEKVERQEPPEPPEPEGWLALWWSGEHWLADINGPCTTRERAQECANRGPGAPYIIRLVRIGGQPQPSAAPAPALTEEEREALWEQLVAEYEYQLNEVVEAETGFAFQPAARITAMRERLGLETRHPQPEQPSAAEGVDHRGLYNKFRVERRDGKAKHKDCTYFVLDLDHDPHAWPALDAYAEHCKAERPELAADLRRMTDPNLASLNYEPIANRVTPPAPAATAEVEEALTELIDYIAHAERSSNSVLDDKRAKAALSTLRAALAQRTVSDEADAYQAEVDRRDIAGIYSAIAPVGTRFLDPPDGGDPGLPEIVRRIVESEAKYRKIAAKVERKVPVEPINDVIDAASVHAFLTPIGSERTRISNALNTVRRWLAEQEG